MYSHVFPPHWIKRDFGVISFTLVDRRNLRLGEKSRGFKRLRGMAHGGERFSSRELAGRDPEDTMSANANLT